ncbi:MAG: hypothetical protein KAR13_21070, partial [Desulfobulbaceae bacterium]|nr:hypothetical protein [Desulfobulbaceae bacterium]
HVKLRIGNKGQADGINPYHVGVYLSSDSTITTADTLLANGQLSFASLPAGAFVDAAFSSSMSIPAGTASGSYYIGVLVDSYDAEPEENETNNRQSQPFVVTTDTWTVMGYFDGDCDREWQALANLDHMEQANQAGVPINLVALVDRHPNNTGGGYSHAKVPSSGTDWSDTRWGAVNYDGKIDSFATTMYHFDPDNHELNVADGTTLVNYVKKMMKVAPAKHYALHIYDHGGMGGIAKDDTPKDDGIDIKEIRAAFDALPHIDIVLLDACLMQDVEVATELINETDYLIASQAERAFYTNIDKSLKWLQTHSNATPAQFAQRIFLEDSHDVKMHVGQKGCVSVLDMNELPALNQSIDTFATTALATAVLSDWNRFRAAISGVEWFHWYPYRDLEDYMDNIVNDTSLPSAFRNRAQDVIDQLDDVVLHQKGKGNGLNISIFENNFHPGYNGSTYNFINIAHSHGTHWREFLANVQSPPAFTVRLMFDWGNSIYEARVIGADPGRQAFVDSVIDDHPDVDFFSFTASAGQVLYADVFGDPANGGLKPVLTLYGPDRETVVAQAEGNDNGVASLTMIELPESGDYYPAVTSLGNLDPLNPTENQTLGTYSMALVYGDAAALAPHLEIEAPYLFVGDIKVGSWGSSLLRLSNSGGTALAITEFVLPEDSLFRVPDNPILLPIILAPGDFMDLSIGVKPDTIGSLTDNLTIVSTDPDQFIHEVVLEAMGVDPVSDCPDDPDNDGDMDGRDLAQLMEELGRTDCYGYCEGDFNGDGKVDETDISIFADSFGRTGCP